MFLQLNVIPDNVNNQLMGSNLPVLRNPYLLLHTQGTVEAD